MFFSNRFIHIKWAGEGDYDSCNTHRGDISAEQQCLTEAKSEADVDLLELQEEVSDSGFLSEHLDGDPADLPVERFGDIELVKHADGVYFYEAREGESRDEIFQALARIPRFSYLDYLWKKGVRNGEQGFNGIPDVIPYPMSIPIPSDPNERMISDEEFVTRYAEQALFAMLQDSYYGPYLKHIVFDQATREEVVAMMLAVAKGESGVPLQGDLSALDEPIGTGVDFRYEPRYEVFSYSCFHVLMNPVGDAARRRLDMTEGQTYHYYNACRLFLAFLVEKSKDRYLRGVLDFDGAVTDEKLDALPILRPTEISEGKTKEQYESEGVRFVLPPDKGGPTETIQLSYQEMPAKLASPLGKRVLLYLQAARRSTVLSADDMIGAGVDEKGPFAMVCLNGGACSGKLRLFYPADQVMNGIQSFLPNGEEWDTDSFKKFYGATNDSYAETLRESYYRTLGWMRGRDSLPEQNLNRIYYGPEFEASGSLNGVRFFTLESANIRALSAVRQVVGLSGNVISETDKGFLSRSLDEYVAQLSPPEFLKKDQIGLKNYGEAGWRLIYCRDRHCAVVPLASESRDAVASLRPRILGEHQVVKTVTVEEGQSLAGVIRRSDLLDTYFDSGYRDEVMRRAWADLENNKTWGSKDIQPGDQVGYGFRDPATPNWNEAYLVIYRPPSGGNPAYCSGKIYGS